MIASPITAAYVRGVGELDALRAEVDRLRAENSRLTRLLRLSPKEAQPPGPAQAAFFEAPPGTVNAGSAPAEKVAFFAALFGARRDRDYLPLTAEVLTAHLSGQHHLGGLDPALVLGYGKPADSGVVAAVRLLRR